MEEQEKAVAYRQGGTAFKEGKPIETNPYRSQVPEKAHQTHAWDRGWLAEKTIRSGFNTRERRA